MNNPTSLTLLSWDAGGKSACRIATCSGTLAVGGSTDCDITIPAMGSNTVFIKFSESDAVIYSDQDNLDVTTRLTAGKPEKIAGLTWLLLLGDRTGNQTDLLPPPNESSAGHLQGPDSLLLKLSRWLSQPMQSGPELRESLKEFLSLTVRNSPAVSGMIALSDRNGFDLISSYGVSPAEAQRLWEKMPDSLNQDILRSGARILLPDSLRNHGSGDTTVFVKGIRSVAGFPVYAEGRLVAIFYLGFENMLKQLSPEVQELVESAADILGLVIHRAELREQLSTAILSGKSGLATGQADSRLMIGSSEQLQQVYRMISKLAPVDVPVLIQGETGTGKELAAREMHRFSARTDKPFIVINAAALPATLIESELFGHRKGSFTGALTDKAGVIESAAGGTLFIDEIGELSAEVQAKLLRVLQERAVTRLGDPTPRPVDFRLVTATHRNLPELVTDGRFREDLYYRIAGATILMPALKGRREDIIPLANYFKQMFIERHNLRPKDWSWEARAALESAEWTGNIRELQHVVSRALVMAEGSVITAADLGIAGSTGNPAKGQDLSLDDAKDEWLRTYLKRALQRYGGRRAETARALGIGERTLFRYIEQLGIRDT